MMFIIILIALLTERFFDWQPLRHWRWFQIYLHWFERIFNKWPPFCLFIFEVLPILLVAGFIVHLALSWLYGLPELIVGTVILLYCLGPANWWEEAYRTIPQKNNIEALFIAVNQRIFAVIFWFVLAGPVGAIFYRLVNLISEKTERPESSIATALKKWLDWLPIRVLALFFALAGHFTDVFACIKEYFLSGVNTNDQFLSACGMKALDLNEHALNVQVVSLVDRVFIMVLVLLAIIVLIMG